MSSSTIKSEQVRIVRSLYKNLTSCIKTIVLEVTQPSEVGLDALSSSNNKRTLQIAQWTVEIASCLLELERKLAEEIISSTTTTTTTTSFEEENKEVFPMILGEAEVQLEISVLEKELEEKKKLIKQTEDKLQRWIQELTVLPVDDDIM